MNEVQQQLLNTIIKGIYKGDNIVVSFYENNTCVIITDYSTNSRGTVINAGKVIDLLNTELQYKGFNPLTLKA